MENQHEKKRFNGSIALRKIPVNTNECTQEMLSDSSIDEIKIIELSTAIDRWEQEVLFCENGFYSLKGKEVQDKQKEYIEELKNFIESEIENISFKKSYSKEKAQEIKLAKINALKSKMDAYSIEQLNNWEMNTYEDALGVIVKNAVLYKNNPVVVENAFFNALKIIEFISCKENWNNKLTNYRKKQFASDFYLALINEFIKDKDIIAYQYFNKYKEEIPECEKEKLEKQINKMKVNIIASNWAKEVFSYNLDDKEFDKELNNIQDENIKTTARQFYFELKQSDKRNKTQAEKKKNIDNWKEVSAKVQEDVNTAELYIDYSLNNESIKSKKEYIKQFRETGFINTDLSTFLTLIKEVFTNFKLFKDKDISDYQGYLSKEDFFIFENIQKYTDEEIIYAIFDYNYIQKLIKESEIKCDDEKYNLIKMYFISVMDYKKKKNDKADIETRKKIIDSIFSVSDMKKERKEIK